MDQFKRILIVTGHYGSGKTNAAVNLALRLAAEGKEPVTIIDLDIVNPYFRTADFRRQLEEAGVRVITPVYANTNLDSPVLPPEISGIFRPDSGYAVIDVGGDDAGAIALGQFSSRIQAAGYEMFYVINEKRYLTRNADAAAELLSEIETTSRLTATKIINNTNLGEETTLDLVKASLPYADRVCEITGLPLAFTCIDRRIPGADTLPGAFLTDILVRQSMISSSDYSE